MRVSSRDQSHRTWLEKTVTSPVGRLRLITDGKGLSAIFFENHKGRPEPEAAGSNSFAAIEPTGGSAILDETARQLQEYFEGTRSSFDLLLSLHGTPFQKRVWSILEAIPFGKTTSYGAIAKSLGNENGSRAVGGAVGNNPVSIVVPCHRVIGTNKTLTGFAGGLDRKRWLLEHEGIIEPLVAEARNQESKSPSSSQKEIAFAH